MAELLKEWGQADVIGVNCGDGPSGIYEMAERMRAPGLPLAAMPNAGIPRRVDGRFVYMANREYFGVYANRLLKLGVRLVGGCCGTTPDHISAAWWARSRCAPTERIPSPAHCRARSSRAARP